MFLLPHLLWLILFSCYSAATASTVHQVAKNFRIIRSSPPVELQSLEKRDVDRPLPDTLSISFEAYDKTFKLTLTKLDGLIHPEAQVTVLTADDSTSASEPIEGAPYQLSSITANGVPLKEGEVVSIGRFHVSQGLEVSGGFEWQGALFRLRPRGHPALTGADLSTTAAADGMIVTRDWMDERRLMNSFGEMALARTNQTISYRCGHDLMGFNKNPIYHEPETAELVHDHQPQPLPRAQPLQALFAKRADSPGGAGCQGKRKVLYIGIAADSLYLQKFGNSRQRALQNILTDFALVSAIYEKSFNVELGILSIVLLDGDKGPSGDQVTWNLPCTPEFDIGRRLNEFSRWRAGQNKQIGN